MHQLFTLVECQLGFPLFEQIEKTKVQLGQKPESQFIYDYPGIEISEVIQKMAYEETITETIDDILKTMMDVFTQANLTPLDIDQVCLTGGTSQLPLIRTRLAALFGSEKLVEYNIYQSVVNGLAQFAKRHL